MVFASTIFTADFIKTVGDGSYYKLAVKIITILTAGSLHKLLAKMIVIVGSLHEPAVKVIFTDDSCNRLMAIKYLH